MAEVNFMINLTYGEDAIPDDPAALESGFLVQFVFWGIILPIMAFFGFLGNLLTMVVLWRKEMRSTTILYLRALVLTDTGVLILAVISLTPLSIAIKTDQLYYFKEVIFPQIYTPCNYLIMSVQGANVYITVCVSIERYIAICHPFRALQLCTRKKALIAVICTCFLTIVYNLPRVFATASDKCTETNGTSTCYVLYTTDFGNSVFYKTWYSGWLYCVIIYILPLSLLFVLNTLLILELMRMQRRRVIFNSANEQSDEANMSLVLVLIVIVFIVCQTPGLISQFDIFSYPVFLKWLAVANTLVVLNSSINFLIYTAVGRKFRKVLIRRVFRPCISKAALSRSQTLNGYQLTPVNDTRDTQISQSLCTEKASIGSNKI